MIMKKFIKGFVIAVAVLGGIGGLTEAIKAAEVIENERDTEMKEKAQQEQSVIQTKYELAVERAVEIIENNEAFSPSAIVGQLMFEGYSKDLSWKALNSVIVDWKSQACKSAEEMLKQYKLSSVELFEKLVAQKFSKSEALYAVEKVYK